MAKESSNKKTEILQFIQMHPAVSSKEIHDGINIEVSYATLKRILKIMIAENLIVAKGKGKATKYEIDPGYAVVKPVDTTEYFKKEVDEREIQKKYNPVLIRKIILHVSLFTQKEMARLNSLLDQYTKNVSALSKSEFNNELERLAIDLSWKSSQIEGNTYSLLETERLLKDKETAEGKTRDEATMLINHKEALDFIIQNKDYIHPLSVSNIEDIHSLLTKEMNINTNVRTHRVGISGTNYTPLDNEFQINEALQDMCDVINNRPNPFEKVLLSLVLISYIQPFADGNKRTARIISNAILINNHYCPISFRTVDSVEYKKAMLIFMNKIISMHSKISL